MPEEKIIRNNFMTNQLFSINLDQVIFYRNLNDDEEETTPAEDTPTEDTPTEETGKKKSELFISSISDFLQD